MIIRHTFRVLVPLLLLAACTTTLHRAPVAPDTEMSFQPGARIAVSRYPIADFAAMTPGKATFAMLGALAMISEGNSFIKDNGIADPAIDIGAGVRKGLVDKYHLVEFATTELPLHDDSLETIIKSYSASDFVVDVKTINWSYGYMPVNWDSYHVRYVARARLIDVKNSRIVAEDYCARNPKELSDAVSHEKLIENHGQFLRAKLSTYSADCANELAKRMLKIDGPVASAVAIGSALSSQPGQPTKISAATDVNAPLPYLKPRGQEYFKEFLTKPLPRAFAISDTAHYAAAWGARPKDPSKPIDIRERALQNCREVAHKECVLYMVDNEVVYKK